MSGFFKVSTRIMVVAIVYMTLVYSMAYAFTPGVEANEIGVVLPGNIVITRTNITNETIKQSIIDGAGWLGGAIGAIVGGIVGVALIVTGIGAPVGFALIALSGIAGATGGAFFGWSAARFIEQEKIDSQITFDSFDEFCYGIQAFVGAIFDFFMFIVSFVSFGIISDVAYNPNVVDVPDNYAWIFWFMTLPVWLYFLVVLAGFSVEAWKAIKIW